MLPHTHHGYEHNENDGNKGATDPDVKENKTVDTVTALWYNSNNGKQQYMVSTLFDFIKAYIDKIFERSKKMIIPESVKEFAKEHFKAEDHCAKKLKSVYYVGEWNGYNVFAPVFDYGEDIPDIGIPSFIMERDGIIRESDPTESRVCLSLYPDDNEE